MSTPQQTAINLAHIREQIKRKTQSKPYFATIGDVKRVVSEVDRFPYQRFFRGEYTSSVPIVSDRQGGYIHSTLPESKI